MTYRVVLALLALLAAAPALAQDRPRRGFRIFPRGTDATDFSVNNVPYDGRLTFTRFRFTPSRTGYGGGGGYFGGINYQWDHDYPRADVHLMTLMDEVTTIATNTDGTNILGIDDAEIFKYPIIYMSEPGYWTMTDDEVALMRNYLLKGGFLIVDDFAGYRAFANFQAQIRRVLPEHSLVQLEEPDHPIFHSFFDIDSLAYRHPYYDVSSMFFAVFEDNDPRNRIMVIVNFNNDIGESWEWSDTGFIPIPLSNEAFKLGVNYLVYAMTH